MKEKLSKIFSLTNAIFSLACLITGLVFTVYPLNDCVCDSPFLPLALPLSFFLNPLVIIFDIITAVIAKGKLRKLNIILLIADVLLELFLFYAIVLTVG